MTKKKRTVDPLTLLPETAYPVIDRIGYALLKKNGYKTEGATESDAVRYGLLKAMKKRGEILRRRFAQDDQTGHLLFWFELERCGKVIDKSQGIKFVPKAQEETKREGDTST